MHSRFINRRVFSGSLVLAPLALSLTSPVFAATVGQAAPDFSAADTDGKTRKLSDYKGKLVVLNVFASWCGPCREEHPFLMQIAASPPFASGQSVMAGLNHKDDAENARRATEATLRTVL